MFLLCINVKAPVLKDRKIKLWGPYTQELYFALNQWKGMTKYNPENAQTTRGQNNSGAKRCLKARAASTEGNNRGELPVQKCSTGKLGFYHLLTIFVRKHSQFCSSWIKRPNKNRTCYAFSCQLVRKWEWSQAYTVFTFDFQGLTQDFVIFPFKFVKS